MPTSRTPLRATVKDIDPIFFSLVRIQFVSMFRLTDLTIFSRVALHKFPKMAETPKCHFFVRIDVGCQLVGPPCKQRLQISYPRLLTLAPIHILSRFDLTDPPTGEVLPPPWAPKVPPPQKIKNFQKFLFFQKLVYNTRFNERGCKKMTPQKNTPPKIYPPKFFFLKSIFKNVLGSVDAKKAPPPKK